MSPLIRTVHVERERCRAEIAQGVAGQVSLAAMQAHPHPHRGTGGQS
jgi:hypothetical protein